MNIMHVCTGHIMHIHTVLYTYPSLYKTMESYIEARAGLTILIYMYICSIDEVSVLRPTFVFNKVTLSF